jgi:hypothetical protein
MTSKNFTKYTVEILVHDDVDPTSVCPVPGIS